MLEAYSRHTTIKGDKLPVYECVFVEFGFNTTKLENRSQNLKMGGGFRGSIITKNSHNKKISKENQTHGFKSFYIHTVKQIEKNQTPSFESFWIHIAKKIEKITHLIIKAFELTSKTNWEKSNT